MREILRKVRFTWGLQAVPELCVLQCKLSENYSYRCTQNGLEHRIREESKLPGRQHSDPCGIENKQGEAVRLGKRKRFH